MKQYSPGELIGGGYRVERVFGGEGKSGMGVVYLVSGDQAPCPFVLKTIQPHVSDGIAKKRFLEEAETWVSIGWHPNVVRALWVRVIDDTLYVAADYIAPDDLGRNSLTDFLSVAEKSPFQIARWMSQICYGLMHAQSKGMRAHRDLKPDNVLIDRCGDAKITDFGISSRWTEGGQIAKGSGVFPVTRNHCAGVCVWDSALYGTRTVRGRQERGPSG